jgi:hypothetical protein
MGVTGVEHPDAGKANGGMNIEEQDAMVNKIADLETPHYQTFTVDSARLAYGSWCYRVDKQIGEDGADGDECDGCASGAGGVRNERYALAFRTIQ